MKLIFVLNMVRVTPFTTVTGGVINGKVSNIPISNSIILNTEMLGVVLEKENGPPTPPQNLPKLNSSRGGYSRPTGWMPKASRCPEGL